MKRSVRNLFGEELLAEFEYEVRRLCREHPVDDPEQAYALEDLKAEIELRLNEWEYWSDKGVCDSYRE